MSACPLPTAQQKSSIDQESINNLCEYLKIPSVHPDINYDKCVEFLEKQAINLNLPIKVYYIVPKKPVVVITWAGTEPNLPSILLNSHMDVVPVFENKWTHKPFAAEIDEHNNLYGRGTQDMKSVGIQYLEAIKRLKQKDVVLKRTVHVSFVPDEEIGGIDGMSKFVHTKEFEDLNVGVALDESVASPTETFFVFYGEKCLRQFHIHCPGDSGHGSLLLNNTAGEKVTYILGKFFEFRSQQIQKLKNNPSLTGGDVTSINLTKMRGGVQTNVIPEEFIISFDCRVPPTEDFKKWEDAINQWCQEAGSGVWIEYELKQSPVTSTKLDDSNIYWVAFKEAADELELKLKTQLCSGATDSRYIRSMGKAAIGFSPINNTPILLHNHDEYIPINVFLRGIEIYCKILTSIGNKTQ